MVLIYISSLYREFPVYFDQLCNPKISLTLLQTLNLFYIKKLEDIKMICLINIHSNVVVAPTLLPRLNTVCSLLWLITLHCRNSQP